MKNLILIVVSLFSFSVLAADKPEGGEFFYQPEAEQTALNPFLTLARTDVKTDTSKYHTSSADVTVRYLYGINENIAIGGDLGFSSTKIKGDGDAANANGLEDIKLSLVGRQLKPQGVFRYGVDVNISPEPTKTDANGDRDNQFSGRNEITPYIGYEFLLSETSRVGGAIRRSILIGDDTTENSSGTKSKTEGGELTSLAAYYEMLQAENNVFGAVLVYSMQDDIESTTSSASVDGLETLQASAYTRYQLQESMYLTGNLLYSKALSDEVLGADLDKLEGWSLSAGVRFLF